MCTPYSDATESSASRDGDLEDFQDFPTCGTHTVIGKKHLEWAHGEVQFEETNLHGKYLIVPEGIKDASDVLAVMCSLWGLSIPELFLAFDGGQDTASGMVDNVLDQDVWSSTVADGGHQAAGNFSDALVKTAKGIATACSESKAWVYGFDGSYGSADGDEMWGTCFNTAWSYFGQGRRSSSACQRVEFICTKGLRGLFGERKFRKHAVILSHNVETVVHYPSVSHRLQRDGKTVPDCVEAANGRMNRPERSQMIWPEFTHVILYDGDSSKYPFPDIYKTMKSLTATVHVVVGGVHPTLTNSVVDEAESVPIVVLRHTGGAADVIAKALEQRQQKNTAPIEVLYKQSADELLDDRDDWRTLKWSSMHPQAMRWSLPATIKENNFVIVDVKRDTALNVVDKILRVLAYTDDTETRQLGASSLEHDRLQEAWKAVVCYKYNAAHFGLTNALYTYAIMALALLTVVGAILKILLARMDEQNMEQPLSPVSLIPFHDMIPAWLLHAIFSDLTLEIGIIVLPLMSGFFLSCISRFSPHHKWGQLVNAANMIKSEIYRYRCRVGEYSRRQGHALDLTERIRRMPGVRRELLCRRTAQAGSQVSSQASTACNSPRGPPSEIPSPAVCLDFSDFDPSKEPLLQVGDEMFRKKKSSRRTARSRRGAFQTKMEHIHTELGNSDVRLSSLSEPSRRAVRSERMSLVGASDQDVIALQHFGEDFHPRSLQEKILGSSADDGFSTLVADDYVRFRVQPTIANLGRLSCSHGRAIFLLETLRYLATMTCAMVAVLKMYMMIPIVVAFIGLITNIVDFHQFSARLQSVNGALTDLRNLLIWWESLDKREQRLRPIIEHLVEVTESAVSADFLGLRKTLQKPDKCDKVEPEEPKFAGEESEED